MKFNIMAIVIMAIAIAMGTLVGSMVASWIGFAGTIVGTFVIGGVCYALYSLIQGQKMTIWKAILFALCVWLANMGAGAVAGFTGLGGGIIGLFVTATIAVFAWGYIGGTSSPLGATKTRRKSKGRRKR